MSSQAKPIITFEARALRMIRTYIANDMYVHTIDHVLRTYDSSTVSRHFGAETKNTLAPYAALGGGIRPLQLVF